MSSVIEYGNGTRATCPLTGSYCDSACMWLQSDDEGSYLCSVALIPVLVDMFSPQVASKFTQGQRNGG